MSCPKTRHLLIEYFDDSLPPLAREEIEHHLAECRECASELDSVHAVQTRLDGWHEQRVPHWDRGIPLFKEEHGGPAARPGAWLWQWLPTAASLAMLVLLIFNVSVTRNGNGFTVAFGHRDGSMNESMLTEQLTQFAQQQQQRQEQALQLFLSRIDERQDSNNLRLMQAVLEHTQQLSSENFEQMYSYFEQQRQLDMENVQVGYQQLLDSDFETLRTMEQLASFVEFQGEIR